MNITFVVPPSLTFACARQTKSLALTVSVPKSNYSSPARRFGSRSVTRHNAGYLSTAKITFVSGGNRILYSPTRNSFIPRPLFSNVQIFHIFCSSRPSHRQGSDESKQLSVAQIAIRAAAGVAGVAAAHVTLAEPAQAISREQVQRQLEEVPVFVIADATNRPFTAVKFGDENGRFALFFVHRKDALAVMNKMKKDNPKRVGRLVTVRLDQAYKMMKESQEQAQKLEEKRAVEERMKKAGGQDAKEKQDPKKTAAGADDVPVMVKLVPSSAQLKQAVSILKGTGKKISVFQGTPIFQAQGLTMRQGNDDRQYIPLFFTKQDLEAAWAEMRKGNPTMSPTPRIEVGSFEEVLKRMEDAESSEWSRVVFFAPKETMDFLNKPYF